MVCSSSSERPVSFIPYCWQRLIFSITWICCTGRWQNSVRRKMYVSSLSPISRRQTTLHIVSDHVCGPSVSLTTSKPLKLNAEHHFKVWIPLGRWCQIQEADEIASSRICRCLDELGSKSARWWNSLPEQDRSVCVSHVRSGHFLPPDDFPPGVPFPRNFRDTVRTIFRRLFRIYAHIYSNHFDHICALGIEGPLCSSLVPPVIIILLIQLP